MQQRHSSDGGGGRDGELRPSALELGGEGRTNVRAGLAMVHAREKGPSPVRGSGAMGNKCYFV